MNYGINNRSGQPSSQGAVELLGTAYELGVRELDTSDLYGTSDEVIAQAQAKHQFFQIHTKFILDETLDLAGALKNSQTRLRVEKLASYSFHRFADFRNALSRGSHFEEQVSLIKHLGQVKKIGVSVYSNEEALLALNCPWVDQIQMPLNLLDHGARRSSVLKAKKNKEIHVRSVFLQGLFHMDFEKFPEGLRPLLPTLKGLKSLADDLKLTLPQLAFLYPISVSEIDAVVVGAETIEQLKVNLDWFSGLRKLDTAAIKEIEKVRVPQEDLLSPVNWPK